MWFAFPNYAQVVSCDKRFNIAHAAIANLDYVPIENLMQFMVQRKVFIEAYEIAPDVCANVFAEWCIELNNIMLPIPMWLLWCISNITEIVVEIGVHSLNVFSSDESDAMCMVVALTY